MPRKCEAPANICRVKKSNEMVLARASPALRYPGSGEAGDPRTIEEKVPEVGKGAATGRTGGLWCTRASSTHPAKGTPSEKLSVVGI